MNSHTHTSSLRTSATPIWKLRARLWLSVFALLASACTFDGSDGDCGGSLTNNYRFDRWCGDQLCSWTTLTGPDSTRRVATWHENEYGVELVATPTVLTQKRFVSASCFEIELIADVDVSANVEIGIDYNFDGDPNDPADEADVSPDLHVDDSIMVPSAQWKKLTFLFPAPTNYSGVRFVIRKTGVGRAVIAEVRVQSSNACTTEPEPLTDQPLSLSCAEADECHSGICATITPVEGLISLCEFTNDADDHDVDVDCAAQWNEGAFNDGYRVCSECDDDADCPGEVCGVVDGRRGLYRACVPPGAIGARCNDDHHCAGEMCTLLDTYLLGSQFAALFLPNSAVCSECRTTLDCGADEVCGLDPEHPSLVCLRETKPLAARCDNEGECSSGVCCHGRCSECCTEGTGADVCPSDCTERQLSSEEQSIVTPFVCGTRINQAAGANCFDDADCGSGMCIGSERVCKENDACIGSICEWSASNTCSSFISTLGTCQ